MCALVAKPCDCVPIEERTLKDADGSSKVVDPPGGLESGGNDRGGGNEIISEGVVQVALANGD
jgi:hypothetical protein